MQPDSRRDSRPIAPLLHTLAILLVLALFAATGPRRATLTHPVRYITTAVVLWMLLGSVVAGIYQRRRFFFKTLQSLRTWYADVGWGVLFYIVTFTLTGVASFLLRHTSLSRDQGVVQAMAPTSVTELAIWFIVAMSAGFCEEHIFRGYLLKQATAWTLRLGSSSFIASLTAIVTTSLLFGMLHLYQGVPNAIIITGLGVMFALMALRCGNLRAVIVAHFLQDFVGFAILLHRSSHFV